MDIYVNSFPCGDNVFMNQVFVDGQVYDWFTSIGPLTWSEQWDVAAGYKEGLTGDTDL